MEGKARRNEKVAAARGRHEYTVFFEPQPDGSYSVVFPSIPEIVTFGKTLSEARRMAADALRCHLEGMLKDNQIPPVEKKDRRKPLKAAVVVTV
jgi:predicted RNase H-like HicB family nuclease